jgi:hypothetical protein
MQELAPVIIGTYNRIEHLIKTVEALKQNTLAKKSELYIFSDGPKEGDEKIVDTIRKYIHTIHGFKKIHIIERKINDRIANLEGAAQYLLEKYGKFIFLEDDIVTAPGFLQFMNDSLNIYEDRDDILSICGYVPNLNNFNKEIKDSFIFQNYLTWGLGIWQKKFNQIKPIDESDYLKLINDEIQMKYVKNNCGVNFIKHFEDQCYSGNHYGDVRGTFLEYLNNMYTVYPKKSLVQNIGHDGSGLHSGITNKFDVELWDKTDNFILDRDVKINEHIKNEMITYFSPNEDDIDKSVIDNIVRNIKQSNCKSFSIWGTNQLTGLVLKEMECSNIKINHFVCSWAKDNILYNGHKVITPQEALQKGETNFIIMSFASRFKMRDAILRMTKKELNLIMYDDYTSF